MSWSAEPGLVNTRKCGSQCILGPQDMRVLEVRRERARRKEEETEQRVRALEKTKASA